MSWQRRFIWLFWLFVITMLIWQFYAYNQKISTPDPAHPTQDHFFFYQPDRNPKAAAPAEHGPFVQQTGFSVSDNTPTSVSFTCHVTVKNTGKSKAINITMRVRPFRGSFMDDPDDSRSAAKPIKDTDTLGQFGQYLSFPDLDPGASATENVVFMKQAALAVYGKNPAPEITCQAAKK